MRRLLIIMLLGASVAMSEPMDKVTLVFEYQLNQRGIEFQVLDDGRYELVTPTGGFTIALDNLSRQFAREQDEAAVDKFIDSILDARAPLPSWEDAQAGIFPMLESSELEVGANTIGKTLTYATNLLLVYFNEDAGTIHFLRSFDLEDWNVGESDVWAAAESRLDRLMQAVEVSYLDAGDLRIGVIEAHEPHKASLIRAPSLKTKVERELGWPVYAVTPSRGFVYLLGHNDSDQIGRLGNVVLKEFSSAEYPISTEIWKIGDNGIEAIGHFPTE